MKLWTTTPSQVTWINVLLFTVSEILRLFFTTHDHIFLKALSLWPYNSRTICLTTHRMKRNVSEIRSIWNLALHITTNKIRSSKTFGMPPLQLRNQRLSATRYPRNRICRNNSWNQTGQFSNSIFLALLSTQKSAFFQRKLTVRWFKHTALKFHFVECAIVFIQATALGSYPSSYPHSIKPKPHVIYHHQPAPQQNNYYHPPSRLTHIDFSPIFLAIVPIALFLGAAAAFALASAVSSSSAVATAQQQQQQQEESSNNNNNDNNNNNNNINTILALLAAFHEVKKHHDDHHKIVIVTTTTPTSDTVEEVANEVPVTTDPPLPPPPPTGPFFIKLSSSTTESPPAPLQSYGHYERKKITYHHMNGIT